jgi:hypothetical protein
MRPGRLPPGSLEYTLRLLILVSTGLKRRGTNSEMS